MQRSTRQIVSRLIDELEAIGYVERRSDPADWRAKLVVLTERGREEQRLADEIIADIERRHARLVGHAAYAEFHRALRAITESTAPAAPRAPWSPEDEGALKTREP